jgi:[protein-PII] uridylyltransferase
MAPDQPARFATLAGCFAIKGADILNAEIFTTRGGTAMDLFVVRLPETDAAYFWPAFTKEARTSLTDPHALATRIAARGTSPLRRQPPPGPKPQVRLYAETPILEARASDRPGRLFDITWELALHGVSVQAAKIATHGDHIHDIFFLQQAPNASWRLTSTLQPLLAAILRRLQTE